MVYRTRWQMVLAGALAAGLAVGNVVENARSAEVGKSQDKPRPSLDTSFEAKWKDLIAKAQKEGEVVIIMGGSDSRHNRAMLDYFSKQFGIKVIGSTGSGTSNTNRLLAERSRGSCLRHTRQVQGNAPSASVPLLRGAFPSFVKIQSRPLPSKTELRR